jgi:hypothetical protein
MKRLLPLVVLCLTVGHGFGAAQRPSPYQALGDLRSLSCTSWTSSSPLDRDLWLKRAPIHAWVYGFVAGAGYMPPPFEGTGARAVPIDVRGIDARMNRYCAAYPQHTLEAALASLLKELSAMR